MRVVTGYCMLFGEALDRKTLWDKIDSALRTACAKVGGEGDTDRWIDLCLDHIRAEPGKAARLKAFTELRDSLRLRDLPWRRAFLRYVEHHRYAVLAYARARWEQVKQEMKARTSAAGAAAKQAGGAANEIRGAAAAESEEVFEEIQL